MPFFSQMYGTAGHATPGASGLVSPDLAVAMNGTALPVEHGFPVRPI